MLARSSRVKPRFRRWFVGSGLFGLAITAVVLALGHIGMMLPWALYLWPFGLYGLRFNNDLSGALYAVPVMFGGQFLLYGLLGLLVRGFIWLLFRGR